MKRLALALAAAWLCAGARADLFRVQPGTMQVGANPCSIAAGDLTDDGWPEIVTADRGVLSDPLEERPANDELSLLVAQGDGRYQKHHPSLKTGFGPYAVALANIDALKWPDIVVANFLAVKNRDVMLYLNLRTENLYKPYEFSVSDDLVPYTFANDGDGRPLFTTPGFTALAIRDLNHDGLRDLCATAWSSDMIALFPGDKEVYFGAPRLFPAEGAPRDLQFGDFDGDGEADLAVALYGTGEIGLWRGDGKLGFVPVTRFLSRGRLPVRVRVADMNNDGFQDVVVAHCSADDSIDIFYGDGDFNFSVSQEIMLGTHRDVEEEEIRDLLVEDLNDDGAPDIVAACHASGKVTILLNQSEKGERYFRMERETHSFKAGKPRALCAADFNQDGKRDIAVALWETNGVALMLQQ